MGRRWPLNIRNMLRIGGIAELCFSNVTLRDAVESSAWSQGVATSRQPPADGFAPAPDHDSHAQKIRPYFVYPLGLHPDGGRGQPKAHRRNHKGARQCFLVKTSHDLHRHCGLRRSRLRDGTLWPPLALCSADLRA